MPFTTVVSGTTITAAWGNQVRDQSVTPFASAAARASAVTSPVQGMVSYLADSDALWVYNGTAWVMVRPSSASVTTAESTTSTSFTDLTTSGPAVTLDTGTAVIVHLTCEMFCSASNLIAMSFAVSGATTLAAADTRRLMLWGSGTDQIGCGIDIPVSGLTAGSNTFTAKYRTAGGTATFQNRRLIVKPQ